MSVRLPRLRARTPAPAAPVAPSTQAPSGPRSYRIGSVSIELPAGHRLPEYQEAVPLYDRFVPLLAERLSGPDLIVDVGANVGDTVAALVGVCENPILAIEADPTYYRYLVENLGRVRHGVKPVQTLLGTGRVGGQLIPDGTTSGFQVGEGDAAFTSLDSVVDSGLPDGAGVALIKSAIGGYSWDVLESGEATLRQFEPVLYWDNYVRDPAFRNGAHREPFGHFYRLLADIGYDRVWVFDNYGGLLLSGATFASLASIDDYVASQAWGRATDSFDYNYVLAATARRAAPAEAAIEAYRALAASPLPPAGA
jgi:FkbM family methyltransferase